jgi:germination protein YpeB
MTKKRIIYTILVTLIVVFSSTFAVLMTLERMDYRNYLQGQYSKNMYNLIDSVENIRVNLGKAAIVGSREQSIIVFGEIFRYAATANDKLHSLPIEQQTIGDTSNFLSKVGDFSYVLAKAASEGKELSDEDYSKIDELEIQSYTLEMELNKILSEINEGKVKWGEIRKRASGVFAKNGEEQVTKKFKGIQKQISQYPALIYDGPFSDNVLEIKPRIEEQKKVSKEQAEKIVRNILGENSIENIRLLESDGKTRIYAYRFNVIMKGREEKKSNVICEVSKAGGKIIYLLDNRVGGEAKLSLEEATGKGNEFLKNMGYNNMIPTYKLKYEKSTVINYVYKQGDVIVYPDQIKLKIALDNGDIIGIESDKYLVSHIENREIPKLSISREEASKRVGKRLKVTDVNLAIIPTETNKEVLCYEFVGAYKDKKYIVYINAKTGYEQRIIEIINTPNGELTI